MSEFLRLITDRILQVPSVWLMVLTPLVVWLSLHRDDNLAQTMFTINPTLKQELARIHSLVCSFTLENQTVVKTQGLSNADRKEQLADKQMLLLDLLGSTLIYEENFLLGFLPLRSYF